MLSTDIYGIIEKINNKEKTIQVNTNIVKVMPYTEIKQEGCRSDWDIPKIFSQLNIGDVVEIDVFYNNGTIIAKEIEVKCIRAH